MSEPLVSVKMITYNHAPYIARAIEGVLQQKTNFPFELVIGEDCSADGTRAIVFDFQKKYPKIVKVVTSEKNVGMRKNSVRTRKECKGKYIAFCEGDDYWHSRIKLDLQIGYLESHPECGLVYSDYDCHFVEINKTIKNFNSFKQRKFSDNLSIEDFISGRNDISRGGLMTCTVAARRELLEQIAQADPILHDESIFLMGDTQTWAEISNISKIHYFDQSLATYNILEESASRSSSREKRLVFLISEAEMLLYLCDKYSLRSEVRKVQESRWCDWSFELAFLKGDQKLADRAMNRCQPTHLKYLIKHVCMKNKILYNCLKRILSFRNRVLFYF